MGLQILLVDDDHVDRELFIDAINESREDCTIFEASNGEEAIQFLSTSDILPHFIIMDLNMPVKNGHETLKEIKNNPAFKSIPVCIMSTSGARNDVSDVYDGGANLFLVKPIDFNEMIGMISCLVTLFGKYITLARNDTVRS